MLYTRKSKEEVEMLIEQFRQTVLDTYEVAISHETLMASAQYLFANKITELLNTKMGDFTIPELILVIEYSKARIEGTAVQPLLKVKKKGVVKVKENKIQ